MIRKHEAIIKAILREVNRAENLHPVWPRDIIHQIGIVCEESGEALRAANQYMYEEGPLSELQNELCQTAATCIRMLDKLNKGEFINRTGFSMQNPKVSKYTVKGITSEGGGITKEILAMCSEHAMLKFLNETPGYALESINGIKVYVDGNLKIFTP